MKADRLSFGVMDDPLVHVSAEVKAFYVILCIVRGVHIDAPCDLAVVLVKALNVGSYGQHIGAGGLSVETQT